MRKIVKYLPIALILVALMVSCDKDETTNPDNEKISNLNGTIWLSDQSEELKETIVKIFLNSGKSQEQINEMIKEISLKLTLTFKEETCNIKAETKIHMKGSDPESEVEDNGPFEYKYDSESGKLTWTSPKVDEYGDVVTDEDGNPVMEIVTGKVKGNKITLTNGEDSIVFIKK